MNPPPPPPSPYGAPSSPYPSSLAGRPIGKARSPGIWLLLNIITLGICGIVWGYNVFSELNRYRGKGWTGGMYLCFSLIPFVFVVSFAVPWLLPSYIGNLYAEDGRAKPITGLSGWWILLPIVGPLVWWWSVNNKLNAFWVSKGAQPA